VQKDLVSLPTPELTGPHEAALRLPTGRLHRAAAHRLAADWTGGRGGIGFDLGAEGQSPASERVTVGVIGVGAQGHVDMRVFLGNKDVRVTALCDVNQRNLDAARRAIAEACGRPDVKVFSDFRELNANPAIDAVLMALPVHWHSIPALDAVLQGKHIYHEKPMALSFGEARRVREAVRRKGVVFQFGTQQRSDRLFRWACQLARSNHENMTAFSLGMISCWGIHHLDIAQWGNGTDETGPTSVEGQGEFPKEGAFDAIERWRVRFEFAGAAPVTFVSDGTPGFDHGVRFAATRSVNWRWLR